MKLPVVGPSYQLDARSFDSQRTINLFPLISESGTSKEISALQGTPGKSVFAVIGSGPERGGKKSVATGRGFVVSGAEFYEVYTDGTTALRGTIDTAIGLVALAENALGEIIIVDGLSGYIFDQDTDAFTEITDIHFPFGTQFVTYQDGYFLCAIPGAGGYAISGINNGLSWDILDRGDAGASPDNLLCPLSDGRGVWMFGSATVEYHVDTGNAAFPFERQQGAIIPTGLAAIFTAQLFDNTVVWLGVDEQGRGIVWKAQGYDAVRISTQAIEKRIASVADYTESYAWVYHQQGHIFYCLQIKGLDTTLVYDGSTGQWHERSFYNKTLARSELDRGAFHMFFAQKNLVGDRENGNLYELSNAIYSDAGDEIHRIRIVPCLSDEGRLVTHAELILDMEPGVGLPSGQGSDPQVRMCYSSDGGFTFCAERPAPIGKAGEYGARARWTRLGQARSRVYKFTITDPVFVQINAAYLKAA